jgi:hypothetical protein
MTAISNNNHPQQQRQKDDPDDLFQQQQVESIVADLVESDDYLEPKQPKNE